MSSKILFAMIVCVLTLWGTIASAQSPKLLDALKLAEEQQKQGKLVEALQTLATFKPTVSEKSPISSLEEPYDENDTDISANEFYLHDKALERLVFPFLENRQSEGAVKTARYIANHALRNRNLLYILGAQCGAVTNKPQDFDLMIGKAERTVLLLTGPSRDEGFGAIASAYARANKFDPAMETVKMIGGIQIRDRYLRTFIQDVYEASPMTWEYEKILQNLIALVQSPPVKAEVLIILSDFYNYDQFAPYRKYNYQYPYTPGPDRIDDETCKKMRFELLRESTEILLTLPDDETKARLLCRIYRNYCHDKHDAEAKNLRDIALKSIACIENDVNQFDLYMNLAWSRSADQRFQDDDTTKKKMILLAEQADDPETKAYRWRMLVAVICHYLPPDDEEQTEILNKARQAFAEIDDPFGWAVLLENHINTYKKGESVKLVLDEAVESLLTGVDETVTTDDKRCALLSELVSDYTSLYSQSHGYEGSDLALELVYSPQIPDAWKQKLYVAAAHALYSRPPFEEYEFRPDDFLKLFNLIESPHERIRIFRFGRVRPERLAQLNMDWPVLIDEVLAIPDDIEDRIRACQDLSEMLLRFGNNHTHDVMSIVNTLKKMVEDKNYDEYKELWLEQYRFLMNQRQNNQSQYTQAD
jgi:hypothetical protein